MSTLELKKELYRLIANGDDSFVKAFYEMAKTYLEQLRKDKMIAEAEEDIEAGSIYSQQEMKDIINNWKE